MVTRTVILVTPSEAAAFDVTTNSSAAVAATSLSLSTPAAAESVVINNAPPAEQNSTELQTKLFNYPSYTKSAQHTPPGGLVQLCRLKGCINEVDFERGGGLCCVHQKNQKEPTDGDQNDSEDASKDDGKICGVANDEELSGTHSSHDNNYCLDNEVGKKRALTSGDSISGKDDIKRQRVDAFAIDLSDVPPQSPIPKSAGYIKEGSSKYTGVYFNKSTNKWHAQIMIDGKSRFIGSSENEEEAAVDYSRAVFKYKGQGALGKAREQDSFIIDLSDVPPQPPIPKTSDYAIKEGASKYVGVSFNTQTNKWKAQIVIEGKRRYIGSYENEEAAAVDYARAVFKYKGQGGLGKAREQSSFIDLSDVPTQPPIPNSEVQIKEASSKYIGVTFNKLVNKWYARIMIEGKNRHIGCYESEEEAAVDYARAVFKYKGQGALDKARERRTRDRAGERNSFIIDLSDVSSQSPIPKCAGLVKVGASKYTGVSFCKQRNKWKAQINIDGKNRGIGHYENEEEAAVDYARAVFKYKKQGALDKAREQNSFIIDLTDVPPQPPIPKCAGHIKEGASKYIGVHFDKPSKKWHAQISIDGKQRYIGCYENEEEAGSDYSRAVFKYKGQGALDKLSERRARDKSEGQNNSFIIDLSDVPPQPSIPKSAGRIKEGASKYTGVTFNKQKNKWQAKIYIDGKLRFIGYYENEEEAAAEYARAVFKYKNQAALGKAREQDSFIIDLSDVPPQPPIPKVVGQIKDGASKYTGVHFNKQRNKKWTAQITIEGKNRNIGRYENEEEAAVDYARALFKYKGQGALDKARERMARDNKSREQNPFIIDLSGVPPQPPITKSAGLIKEGASKYTGVSFNKSTKKWLAKIRIDGKQRFIGSYENEEDAAVDFARAVFKYR